MEQVLQSNNLNRLRITHLTISIDSSPNDVIMPTFTKIVQNLNCLCKFIIHAKENKLTYHVDECLGRKIEINFDEDFNEQNLISLLPTVFKELNNLNHIVFGCNSCLVYDVNVLTAIANNCSELKSLEFCDTFTPDFTALRNLFQAAKQLTKLRVCSFNNFSSSDMISLFVMLPCKLTYLKFANDRVIDNETIMSFVALNPSVTKLTVFACAECGEDELRRSITHSGRNIDFEFIL